jgi:hypothetical protein
MYADTIRVNLHHFKPENDPEGKLACDLEIKDVLAM